MSSDSYPQTTGNERATPPPSSISNDLEDIKESPLETIEATQAKAVLILFSKTFTSLKIYPPDNPIVINFIDSFYKKIKEFLDNYNELNFAVHEFSFSFRGSIIFQEKEKKSSLPFLFFKDGMRELAFCKGLDKEELEDFLKVIKENSDLPSDDSDIVNILWTKDYAHIRYFAIDEFIESDNIREAEKAESSVDTEKFSKGKIILNQKDSLEFYKKSHALGLQLEKGQQEAEADEVNLENMALPFQISDIKAEETPEIESMLQELRSTPPLTEMVVLLFEILHLEERPEPCSTIVNVLMQFYKEIVYKSHFLLASLILKRLEALKLTVSGQNEEKKKLLEKTLQNSRSKNFLLYVKKLFLNGQIEDFDSFFQYLHLIGSNALPIVSDIWEETSDPSIRLKASNFLYDIGKKDVPSLIALAKNHRIALTKEVTNILGRIGDKTIIPYLRDFASHEDKTVRLSVINALVNIQDENINPILKEFLTDEDEEVRIQAAMNLKHAEDAETFNYVLQLAQQKDFKERRKPEKKALLEFLATAKSEEVSFLFKSILKKWSLFSMTKQNETRLCAVPALELMATHEARKILEEGTKIRNRAIRTACKMALRKLSSNYLDRNLAGKQSA